jgi:hypothetical protein
MTALASVIALPGWASPARAPWPAPRRVRAVLRPMTTRTPGSRTTREALGEVSSMLERLLLRP